jgi:glycosyltransferase involved in cell wall biosynthesis
MQRLLSIIVPTFNRRAMLGEAIASVRSQSFKDLEIIVVDGGSTDGTIEWVEQQTDVLLLKGPDRGVYDAFNKGIAHASGEVIGILNSDDLYPEGTLRAVASAFEQNPDADAVCGIAELACDGETVAVYDNPSDQVLRTPRTSLIGACVPNARFFRRSAAAEVGLFDISYKFVSDRDWLTRWYQLDLTTIALPRKVYVYRQHADSLTFDSDRRRELEIRAELLRLAHSWRTDKATRPEVVQMAVLLEGRCRATLALRAARRADLLAFIENLLLRDGRASLAPLLSIARGGIDWLSHRN